MKSFFVVAALSAVSLAAPQNGKLPVIGSANPTVATTVIGIDTGVARETHTAQISSSPTIDRSAGAAVPKETGSGAKVYIETSSDPSLVNQWAVIGSDSGSRVTFSPDANLASSWSVTQDDEYTDVTSPDGSTFVDLATGNYAYVDGLYSPWNGGQHFPIIFKSVEVKAIGVYAPIVPQVSSLIRSVQMVKLATNFFGHLAEKRADKLQVCSEDGTQYLALGDYYEPACHNVTLRYV